jgi:dipeptidyl aminopeptidase/acylaminoacyl peptidase
MSDSPPNPYADLDAYLDVPRASGLALSPDGTRLVTTVATLDPDRTRWVSALWEVDPAGARPARRLTRSAKGEGAPVFAPDGGLLFTSARPDPAAAAPADDAPAALWLLPSTGEARVVATRPGGFGAIAVAQQAGTVVALSDTLPGATDGDSDAERRTARKDAGVDAVLHAGYPVRYWDHDLGVGQSRLLAGELADPVGWRDLTPMPGRGLHEAEVDVSADGRTAVVTWSVADPRASRRTVLVAVDTTTGERTTLFDDPGAECGAPVVSPDGSTVAFLRETLSTPQEPTDTVLVVVPVDGSGEPREVTSGWDLWPGRPAWTPDGAGLLVVADERGAAPVFRVDVMSGEVVRLTGDRGHYTDVRVSPNGRHAYALRDAVDSAPAPVRLDLSTADQSPVHLQGPPTALPPPGRLEEVTATAEDGSRLRSWLVLPEGQGPFPLLLWVHGGPVHSWSGWSWRWNPHLMAARGYAVLLPDPALSTGYGRHFVRRGWGRWGAEPYTDLMAVTDAALEHPAVDPARTAAMGGSFGGYIANWIAGTPTASARS